MMKTVNTISLSGPALDWVIAKLEYFPLENDPMGFNRDAPTSKESGWWVWPENSTSKHKYMLIGRDYSPSTLWAQGGLILEREKIDVWHFAGTIWQAQAAEVVQQDDHSKLDGFSGPSPLVAAMVCYAFMKLGETVEIPSNF